jgi:mRNA-degrading endonuclease RelE of RelBE toxin-antitoxin system
MEILSRKDAIKDIKKIKDPNIKKKIKKAFKKIEGYKNIHEMILDPQCKKMSGSDNAYRVRVGHR